MTVFQFLHMLNCRETNVGHIVRDFEIAQAYLAYWEQLADDAEWTRLRAWNEEHSPNPDGATPPKSLVPLFSPRQKVPTPDRPILHHTAICRMMLP
jgi:hypothetical protein